MAASIGAEAAGLAADKAEQRRIIAGISHLSQDLPRYDQPESLLYDPEIPPWALLPLSASAVHLRLLNSGKDIKYSVIHLCKLLCILGLDLMCLLSPLPRVDSRTLLTPLLLEQTAWIISQVLSKYLCPVQP